MAASRPDVERPKKRAIALAGGGPAMGFHIGALAALEGAGIEFHVWSLSCIGAWVGVYYNQLRGAGRAARTHQFFREHAFRDAQSYRGFPVNRAFAPNLQAFARAWRDHLSSPRSWQDMWPQGREWQEAADGWARFLWSPEAWQRDGDLNLHVLNNVLAVHPVSRMLTSLIYSSGINGLSNLYYRDSSLLEVIDFGGLDISGRNHDHTSREALDALVRDAGGGGRPGSDPAPAHAVPEIYHNAWRLPDDGPQRDGDRGELRVFNNRWLHYRRRRPPREYLPITPSSLCACSALPYIEQTVPIAGDGGRHHSEGALVDTVNFHHLVEDHPDLDEIWVCRIVDDHQVRRPANLHDSLANLCQQFAAEVGENDIKLFKNHLRKGMGRAPRLVEIPLAPDTLINFRWDRDNLDQGVREGQSAAARVLAQHPQLTRATTPAPPWP